MTTEEGGFSHLLSSTAPAPARSPSPSDPASPVSDNQDSRDNNHHESKETTEIKPSSLDPTSFHRGLISLKQMQERSFSLVNQALLRQKLVEEQIKIERDSTNDSLQNNNDDKSVNNNNHHPGDGFDESRRRFLTESSAVAGGRLAFSVENILAPGKFGREMDDDSDNLGKVRMIINSIEPIFYNILD